MIRALIGLCLMATPSLAQVDVPSPMTCAIAGFLTENGPVAAPHPEPLVVTLIHDGDRVFQDPETGFPASSAIIAASWPEALNRAAQDDSIATALILNGLTGDGAYIVEGFSLAPRRAEQLGQNGMVYHCHDPARSSS